MHAEHEVTIGLIMQEFLDLIQGLPAEVLGLEQLRRGLLNQLPYELNARVLQAIARTDTHHLCADMPSLGLATTPPHLFDALGEERMEIRTRGSHPPRRLRLRRCPATPR